MKTLAILLCLASSCFAGVTSILVEDVPAVPARTLTTAKGDFTEAAKPALKRVTAYGLLPDGKAKVVNLTAAKDIAKHTAVENCAKFKHNRKAVRMWIHFDGAGNVLRIDFHMEPPFASLIWPGEDLDKQAVKEIAKLKAFIESK